MLWKGIIFQGLECLPLAIEMYLLARIRLTEVPAQGPIAWLLTNHTCWVRTENRFANTTTNLPLTKAMKTITNFN